jgi:hypothetical protein
MTKLSPKQIETLEAAFNDAKSVPNTGSTANSLIKRGLAERSADGLFLTEAGKEAIGVDAPAGRLVRTPSFPNGVFFPE